MPVVSVKKDVGETTFVTELHLPSDSTIAVCGTQRCDFIEKPENMLQNLVHGEYSEGFEGACILVVVGNVVVSIFQSLDCVPDFFPDFFGAGNVGMSVGWRHFRGANGEKVSPDTFFAS
jgi:hypothetical protein